ncbi:hypothetical protein [Streptomyces bottropensis]|uniref:hypothetical protein n=1 Tax=Streptomyces bottropensis TaxID=42235 RepID=UPI003674393C
MTAPRKRDRSPLLYPAVFLSAASLAWTTWSLVDLLGTGWIGFTVAAGSDIVWGSVIIAEARGLRIAGRSWIVPALGWATLVIVAVFLASHGVARESIAMAAAGPFLPLGSKVVWALALADMRDPAALTHDELHKLAGMERGMVFEEREHDIRMRQQRMRAELLMSEVSTDFDIEVMRQDRVRELQRRAPLSLTAGPSPSTPEPSAEVIGEQPEQPPNAPIMLANTPSEHPANSPLNRPNPVPEQPTIADLVREQIANTPNNTDAINNVMAARPDANRDSVAAAVRRARRKAGPYL